MRVDVTPRQAEINPGMPREFVITITNTATVIGGYAIRVLGADPGWVELETDQVSLFPDESRTIKAIVTAPRGIPAGSRRVAIQVRELTPPEWSTITEIDLTVPASDSVQVRIDPLAVTAGKRATFSVLLENTGNTLLKGHLDGDDPESKVEFAFEPDRIVLAPGQHAVVDMRAKARRRFLGTPVVRMLAVYLDQHPADALALRDDGDLPDLPSPARDEREARANATFIQKSVMSRGALSLLGLLLAVTVFAIVITIALSRLVGQSTADRNLALQVAQARNATGATGTSGVAGTVHLLTSGKPVAGVAISIFSASNTSTAIATTATDVQGAYHVSDLAAGQYKISFRAAGFVQLWYPGAADVSEATTVTLAEGQQQAGLNVNLGGVPSTISGSVVGDDVSAATLFLETLPGGVTSTSNTTGILPSVVTPGVVTPPDNGGAVVKAVPIGSDGSFSLTNVPSPSIYDLVVTKTGYATSVQQIDIGAGETRTGVVITLSKGDGLISGTVTSPTGPLGGVTITATSGQSTVNTVSLTEGAVGSFTLRNLPTPATFTVVASKDGFASQTLTLSLGAGQKLSGAAITLSQSSGSLSGVVTTLPSNAPAPGVEVTVTNGVLTIQTVTESQGSVGGWRVGGLPVPGTYTVTFARIDLVPQTVSVALDAGGHITPGSLGARVTSSGISVSMQSSTSTVSGTVYQCVPAAPQPPLCVVGNDTSGPHGEATVSLNSGTSTYTVTSASVPTADKGAFRLEQIPPGTYTLTVSAGSGTSPNSQIVTITAGQPVTKNVLLAAPASLTVTVECCLPPGSPDPAQHRIGWSVFLYLQTQYPTILLRSGVTDSNGVVTFSGIDAGTYIVATGPTSNPANATYTDTVFVQPSQQRTDTILVNP